MPSTLVIPPNEIALNDFSGGWMPDLAPQAVPPNGLLDVNNMLPDRETGTLETRKGFQRFSDLNLAGFEVTSLMPFNRNSGKTNELGQQYLMVVVHKLPKPNPREADDVRVYVINVQTGVATRIDTPGRTWNQWGAAHWGETIDNFFYGGGELDPIYSYKPVFRDGTTNPHPYEPDASMGQYTSNQWTSGTAYSVGDRVWDEVTVEKISGGTKQVKFVFVATKAHTATGVNRPGKERSTESQNWEKVGKYIPLWVNGTAYKIGDVVSYLVDDVAQANKFPRYYETVNRRSTFIAARDHTASSTNVPPGSAWEPYRAPVSNVAKLHGPRLFVRDSDAGSGRLWYSEQTSSDGYWDPTQWDFTDAQGSGYMDIRSGDGDDIRALESMGPSLIICKRRSTWALRGLNPSNWKLDPVSEEVGCLYKRAITEHEGLVYFVSDQGFYMTDGVVVREVPNGGFIRDWIRESLQTEESNIYRVNISSFLGFLWISFAMESTLPNVTIVYDPVTQSFWKLDFGTRQFATTRVNRFDEMFFSKTGDPALIMRYDPDTNTFKDDEGAALQTFKEIPWMVRLPWLTFGTWKEQRRLRRLWVRIRTAVGNVVTLKYFRDYEITPFRTITRTTTIEPVTHVEGETVRDKDPHALSMEISGDRADASLISVHAETQFRRKRWNRGVRA